MNKKERERKRIDEETERFLSKGGKIQTLQSGFAKGYEPMNSEFLREMYQFTGEPKPIKMTLECYYYTQT